MHFYLVQFVPDQHADGFFLLLLCGPRSLAGQLSRGQAVLWPLALRTLFRVPRCLRHDGTRDSIHLWAQVLLIKLRAGLHSKRNFIFRHQSDVMRISFLSYLRPFPIFFSS